jgi:hypothetical protein
MASMGMAASSSAAFRPSTAKRGWSNLRMSVAPANAQSSEQLVGPLNKVLCLMWLWGRRASCGHLLPSPKEIRT